MFRVFLLIFECSILFCRVSLVLTGGGFDGQVMSRVRLSLVNSVFIVFLHSNRLHMEQLLVVSDYICSFCDVVVVL